MLVICKILGLFVNTLTDDDKYCLLYRDNLTEPIKILLCQKQKNFFEYFSAFFKIYIEFSTFSEKDDPDCRCASQITVCGKGDQINVCKIPFSRTIPQQTWQNRPKIVEIRKTLPLPYLFIPVLIIQLEKVYVSATKNLKTVF